MAVINDCSFSQTRCDKVRKHQRADVNPDPQVHIVRDEYTSGMTLRSQGDQDHSYLDESLNSGSEKSPEKRKSSRVITETKLKEIIPSTKLLSPASKVDFSKLPPMAKVKVLTWTVTKDGDRKVNILRVAP